MTKLVGEELYKMSQKREKMVWKKVPAPSDTQSWLSREHQASQEPLSFDGSNAGGISLLASEHNHNHFLLIIMLRLIMHLNISFLKAKAIPLSSL